MPSYTGGTIYIPNVTGNIVITAVATAATVTSISAVFNQGQNVIYDTDSLDTLKQYLTVTATYTGGETAVVTGYTLSGTLSEGTSTITVSYSGKTTTVNVAVTHSDVPRGYTAYDYVEYTGADKAEDSTYYNAVIKTKVFDNLNNLIIDFDVNPKVSVSSATNVLGGQNGSGNNYLVGFYGRNDTQRISCYSHGTAIGINNIPNMVVGKVCHIRLDPGTASPSTLNVDSLSETGAWTTSNVINSAIGYCSNYITNLSKASVKKFAAIGTLKLYDVSTNNLVGEYFPCVRDADNVIGIWDTVTQAFYTATTASYVTVGGSSCVWAVGNWEV